VGSGHAFVLLGHASSATNRREGREGWSER
jgi:hypothetical protein